MEVAIKECFAPRSSAVDRSLAEREFSALRRVSESARDANAGAPMAMPLVLCAEQGAYAMTWIRGRAVTDVLLSTRRATHAARIGRAAGMWLKRFHALHGLPDRRADYRSKLATVCDLAASNADDALVGHTVRVLVDTADAASDIPLPASWIHGDMKSDNLLIDDTAVAGIDAHIVDENVVLYDLAPFLNHLGLLHWSPRGATRGAVLAKAAAAFLDAYSNDARAWTQSLAWLRAYLLVQALVTARSRPGPGGRLRAWPIRRELENVLRSLDRESRRT